MFQVVTSKRAGASRGYGFVLLWVSSEPRPAYMLQRFMHWYRHKRDAVEGMHRMNRSLGLGGASC